MRCKFNLIQHNGTMYLVQRMVRTTHNPILETWKEHLGSDIILKKGEHLYFCEEIPELQEVQ